MTDRKTAEAARRRVLEIEKMATTTPGLEAERIACVQAWNAFCSAEQRRIDASTRARKDPRVQVYETYRRLGWS